MKKREVEEKRGREDIRMRKEGKYDDGRCSLKSSHDRMKNT
jgi:hypothetical protein